MLVRNSTFFRILVVACAGALTACGGSSSPAEESPPPPPPPDWPPPLPISLPQWHAIGCNEILGAPVATVSDDGGVTVAPARLGFAAVPGPATHSLTAVPMHGGLMFAANGNEVHRSVDGGCSWSLAYEAIGPMRIVSPNIPWLAYAYSERGQSVVLLRADRHFEFTMPFTILDLSETRWSTVYALTADRRVMRLQFHLSEVGWDVVGPAPRTGSPAYLAVNTGGVTPYTDTHMLVSMESGPPLVTFDDGVTWQPSQGLADGAASIVTGRPVFALNLSNRYGDLVDVVWMYVERTASDGTISRVIARSVDGGRIFTDAVAADGALVVFDDPQIIAAPGVHSRIAFTGDHCTAGEPIVYSYDAAEDAISRVTVVADGIIGIESLAYNPHIPDYLYFGPRVEDDCG